VVCEYWNHIFEKMFGGVMRCILPPDHMAMCPGHKLLNLNIKCKNVICEKSNQFCLSDFLIYFVGDLALHGYGEGCWSLVF
jgi:hypothetical protein